METGDFNVRELFPLVLERYGRHAPSWLTPAAMNGAQWMLEDEPADRRSALVPNRGFPPPFVQARGSVILDLGI